MQVADQIVALLSSGCTQILTVGALRRAVIQVRGVKVLAEPRVVRDLFEAPTEHDEMTPILGDLIGDRCLAWRKLGVDLVPGQTLYALRHVPSGIPVDLITVRPPTQWGVALVRETGPLDFWKGLVRVAASKGRKLSQGSVTGEDGFRYSATTEKAVFRACGVDWVPPQAR
jgi:DNA polymerase/3'-5' exonuclease PolX